jgi:replicative DNA helicase
VDRLKAASQYDAVGGAAYLAELFQAVPTAANAMHYAGIVREKSDYRALIEAGTEIVHEAFEQSESADQLLNQAEQRIFSILDGRGHGEQCDLREILHAEMERIDARLRGEHIQDGIDTDFVDLDRLCGGLHNGELVILAARPSMGKTAFALNIAENVAVKGHVPVLFVSLEMSSSELGRRLLSSHAKVNGHRFRSDSLTNEDIQKLLAASGALSSAPLVVDATPSRTVSEIAAVARRMKRRQGLGLVAIDYLQLIEPDNPKDNRQEQVARIARRLKHLARELRVPVLCLAQLNRQAEEGRGNKPRLSHLRESGAIEQDADVVMFVHREEYYADGEEERARVAGEAEIIVAKQRNGPTGEVKLTWLHKYTRFENATRAPYDEFAGAF